MVIPTPAVLPDSTLAPEQVLQKFDSSSLAGLGGNAYAYAYGRDPAFISRTRGHAYAYGHNRAVDIRAAHLAGLLGLGDECGFDWSSPTCGSIVPTTGGGGVQPVGGTDWAAMIAKLAASGVDIAKLYAIRPGTTLVPGGGITMQNPGYPVLTGGNITGTAAGAVSSMSTALILGGIGLLAVLMLSKRG